MTRTFLFCADASSAPSPPGAYVLGLIRRRYFRMPRCRAPVGERWSAIRPRIGVIRLNENKRKWLISFNRVSACICYAPPMSVDHPRDLNVAESYRGNAIPFGL